MDRGYFVTKELDTSVKESIRLQLEIDVFWNCGNGNDTILCQGYVEATDELFFAGESENGNGELKLMVLKNYEPEKVIPGLK